MKKAERHDRWVTVEALCRCAQLERDHGKAMVQHLDQPGEHPRVVAEMRRLTKTRHFT